MDDAMPPAVELRPGEEAAEQKVSALRPLAHYVVSVRRHAQLVVELRESNTASRCVLYVNPGAPASTAKTTTWRAEGSDPKKRIAALPVDDRFQLGPCHIVVAYTPASGAAAFSLRVTLTDAYDAAWPFARSKAIYTGAWRLNKRHGRGRCVYFGDQAAFDRAALSIDGYPGGGVSAATDLSAGSVKVRAQTLLSQAAAVCPLDGTDNSRSAERPGDAAQGIPDGGVELYDGEWADGEKDGEGTYVWPSKRYTGHWRQGKRNGRGALTKADGTEFSGEWRDNAKNGYGVLAYPEGARYEGGFQANKRHGEGTFHYAPRPPAGGGPVEDGPRVRGMWEKDVLVSDVEATFANGDVYNGAWMHDAPHGLGTMRDTNGFTHEGYFVGGLKHGTGTWALSRGVKFRGTWVDGARVLSEGEFVFPSTDVYSGDWDEERHVRHGRGRCTYATGDVYEGEWRDDERSGEGTMTTAVASQEKPSKKSAPPPTLTETYTGHFVRNRRCGFGTCEASDGERYQGEWREDKRHGAGAVVFPDGGRYEGDFNEGQRHGSGRMEAAGQAWVYDGEWSDDRCHGDGTMVLYLDRLQPAKSRALTDRDTDTESAPSTDRAENSSETYNGDWREGRRHGQGTITYPSGDRFTGQWKGNQRIDGPGVCEYADQSRYDGEWKHCRRHGHGVLSAADGTAYDGEWRQDQPCGQGASTTRDGATFSGVFEAGRRVDGQGRCEYSNGDVYEGEWVDCVPHGQGALHYTDGTVFEGTFDHGEYRL